MPFHITPPRPESRRVKASQNITFGKNLSVNRIQDTAAILKCPASDLLTGHC